MDTALGVLTIGTVEYYECTNECNDWSPVLGMLELAGPPDPDRPSVVIVDVYERLTRDEIVALANALRVS